jgi:hypothetical protein
MQNRPIASPVVEQFPQIHIEKPRLGIPITLIVDDPAPCINPLYYYRLQVDRKNYERHEPCIPFDFLEHFIAVCQARGIRGKFSILPYPAGLGSILEGWEGCDRAEIARWLDLVRTELQPDFDITPEILTHTRALDLRTRTLFDQSEQDWMAERTLPELTTYMRAATEMLRAAGFISAGITQPVSFSGSRADYALATLEAVRAVGGPPVTFYFVEEYLAGPPYKVPEVVLLDRERGAAVVDIGNNCPEFCWFTQRPESRGAAETADRFITAGGTSGRLVDLIADDAWLITVCHWQSIFSDGSRAGLQALDTAAARLAQHYGPRIRWLTTGEIARYRAASEACAITARRVDGGVEIELDAAIACPDFTLSLPLPDDQLRTFQEVIWQDNAGRTTPFAQSTGHAALLAPNTWLQAGDRVALCFPLERGRQRVRLTPQA